MKITGHCIFPILFFAVCRVKCCSNVCIIMCDWCYVVRIVEKLCKFAIFFGLFNGRIVFFFFFCWLVSHHYSDWPLHIFHATHIHNSDKINMHDETWTIIHLKILSELLLFFTFSRHNSYHCTNENVKADKGNCKQYMQQRQTNLHRKKCAQLLIEQSLKTIFSIKSK